MKKTLAALLLATALVPAVASAQATSPATNGQPAVTGGAMSSDPAAGNAMNAAPAAGADASSMNDMSTSKTADAGSPFVANDRKDVFRFSQLEGTDIYDRQGQKLGEINDVLMSRDGQLAAVLVGVGGFLGIGEKDVAVNVDKLDFDAPAMDTASNAANGSATTATGTAGAGVDTSTTASTGAADQANEAPQRIVLDTTKEALQGAPAWNEDMNKSGSSAQ